jgi:hypothetical protein
MVDAVKNIINIYAVMLRLLGKPVEGLHHAYYALTGRKSSRDSLIQYGVTY